jgi:hypothetical protein
VADRSPQVDSLVGVLRGIPAFLLQRTPLVKRTRARVAARMATAIGEWPAKGPSLQELDRAFETLSAENIESFRDIFYAFAENHGTVKAAVQNFDLDLQTRINSYGRHVVVLAAGPNWLIRLMEWWPGKIRERFLHTHTFALLTYGLVGPGYTTNIIHVDPLDLAHRKIGEPVTVIGVEDPQRLHQGRRMYYPPHVVAHQQLDAEQYSVSLNLVVTAAHQPPLFDEQCLIDPNGYRLAEVRRED